ncbi:MAG: TrbG/VirB9 family P-type conjugative transfer protein [Sulfurovum sp.]|nr:TrbG/VirB9 family P-type conjugative transfer protein [Sulfurovum sp.]
MKAIIIICIMAILPLNAIANSNKIKNVTYNSNDVLIITAKTGRLTVVEFDTDEEVIDGDTGFNDGWTVKKSGNIAYITPKPYLSSVAEEEGTGAIVSRKSIIEPIEGEWDTNFFIRTNKRLYVGDLKLSNHTNSYKISLSYPKEEARRKREEEEEEKVITRRANKKRGIKRDLNRATVPKNWNFYKKVNKRSEDISPNYVYDDGKFTYFGFDRTKKMPAIFLRDGEEELSVNSHSKRVGKYYVKVVHKTGKVFFLRSGRKLVGILNSGYGINPNLNYDTTSNQLIKRVIR